jgi:hypothetical protein
MTEEDYLHEQLALLWRSYEHAAKPIVERLVRLKSLKPTPYFVVPASSLPSSVAVLDAPHELERFVALAAAAEREACAQVCEDMDLRNRQMRPEYQQGGPFTK